MRGVQIINKDVQRKEVRLSYAVVILILHAIAYSPHFVGRDGRTVVLFETLASGRCRLRYESAVGLEKQNTDAV